jgi:hypothetical protein
MVVVVVVVVVVGAYCLERCVFDATKSCTEGGGLDDSQFDLIPYIILEPKPWI